MYEGPIQDLIDELSRLPGIGPKSAQRLAFHLVKAPPDEARRLADARVEAARIALATDVPVIPIAQWGANHILPPYAKKPRLFPRKTITMKAGDPVDLDDLRGKPLSPPVLREATNRIMDALTRLLEDIRGEQAPAVRFDPRVAGVRATGNPNVDPDKRRHSRRKSS